MLVDRKRASVVSEAPNGILMVARALIAQPIASTRMPKPLKAPPRIAATTPCPITSCAVTAAMIARYTVGIIQQTKSTMSRENLRCL